MNYQSAIFSKYLGNEQMLQIVCDQALISKILSFEAALAKAQSKLGIIPMQSAAEINKVLLSVKITPKNLAVSTLQNGIPIIGILSIVKDKLSNQASQHLHYGATSQDAMDTVQILIFKDAIAVFEKSIIDLEKNLKKILKQYGKTPCIAHTRGQQAIPITFSVKINAWLMPLQRQMQRLVQIKNRLLVLQLGGAAGTLAAYPDKAEKLISAVSKELKLYPSNQWHAQRDNLCEFTNWLAMLTGILGKIGADILVMAQSEINEVVESEAGGKSSAMPHKNNPVLSEALVALSKINATLQSQQLLSMVHISERDAAAWILEWNAIPQMLMNTATALHHANNIAAGIIINTEVMKKNVKYFLSK